ncbi:hypothetical protein JCM1840_001689 [Sporobolomyces johnsonii]
MDPYDRPTQPQNEPQPYSLSPPPPPPLSPSSVSPTPTTAYTAPPVPPTAVKPTVGTPPYASIATQARSPSPPLPAHPTHERRISLSESLQQLQGEAAFVPRPAPGARTRTASGQTAPSIQQAPAVPTEGEEEAVEFYISGLTAPGLFVPLPKVDPVSALLDKYLPPNQRPQRDLTGAWQGRSLEELIAARSWRAVAMYCCDAITQSSPDRTSYILSHWILRFHALIRLHLIDPLAAELSRVYSLLPPSACLSSPAFPAPPDTPLFHTAVPFELHFLAASLPGLQGNKETSVEGLATLMRATKAEMWASKRGGRADEHEWRSRAEKVGAAMTALLAELKATSNASSLLSSASPSPALYQALARLHYSSGNLAAFVQASQNLDGSDRLARKLKVLELVAKGEWAEAEEKLRRLVEEDPADGEVHNNLAVVLLYSAKLQEAITVLTNLLATYPLIAYNDESILFNLSTLLELRTEHAASQKLRLLRSAAEFGGEELPASCFKLAL